MNKKKIKNLENAVKKSGHILHLSAVNIFKGLGWEVKISPYYNDFVTDKPREIDFIASKKYSIGGGKDIRLNLFIETKYILPIQYYVIWQEDKNKEKLIEIFKKELHHFGIEDLQYNDPSRLKEIKHHYINNNSDRAIKLVESYCEKKDSKSKNDYIIEKIKDKNENDPLYQAIIQSLHSVIFFKKYEEWKSVYVANYPIVITNSLDSFYLCDEKGNLVQISTDYLQYEINYTYKIDDKKLRDYFLIDIVNKDNIEKLIKSIEDLDINFYKEVTVAGIRKEDEIKDLGTNSKRSYE